MPLRFASATLLFLVLPLGLTVGLLGAFGLQLVERQTEARMREDIETIARAIEGPVTRALSRGREGAVQEALESAFAFGRVYGAHVLDRDGEWIAGAGAGASAVVPTELAPPEDDDRRTGRYTWAGGEPLFTYFVPISDNTGRFTALLQVSRHAGDFQSHLARLNRIGIIALGLLVAALAAIVLLGHRLAIGRPLAHLTDTMTRISRGESGRRAENVGPLELRRLAQTFNRTMDRLQSSDAEVTRRRRREAVLERRLEHSRRLAAVGELAAGVAHELGTPLSVIDGRAQRLLRREKPDGPRTGDLEAIRAEVTRIGRIIRELQDFARNNPLRREAVALEPLLDDVVDRSRPWLTRYQVALERRIAAGLPAVMLDPDRIRQALDNLLRNAAQAADPAQPRVTIGVDLENDTVVFFVEDNGAGIPKAVADRVFEPFFTTKRVGSGTGLGLSVVHRVAEDHGGLARHLPSPMGGARFELRLPVDDRTGDDFTHA